MNTSDEKKAKEEYLKKYLSNGTRESKKKHKKKKQKISLGLKIHEEDAFMVVEPGTSRNSSDEEEIVNVTCETKSPILDTSQKFKKTFLSVDEIGSDIVVQSSSTSDEVLDEKRTKMFNEQTSITSNAQSKKLENCDKENGGKDFDNNISFEKREKQFNSDQSDTSSRRIRKISDSDQSDNSPRRVRKRFNSNQSDDSPRGIRGRFHSDKLSALSHDSHGQLDSAFLNRRDLKFTNSNKYKEIKPSVHSRKGDIQLDRPSYNRKRTNESDTDVSPLRKNFRSSPAGSCIPVEYPSHKRNSVLSKLPAVKRTFKPRYESSDNKKYQLNRIKSERFSPKEETIVDKSMNVSTKQKNELDEKQIPKRFNITGKDRGSVEDKRKKEREERKQKELQEKYEKWNKGLYQLKRRTEQLDEMARVVKENFARHADDEAMNEHLKNVVYEKDPMFQYVKKKEEKARVKSGGVVYPKYKGSWPPNRFNIAPGYRWDGVNRSNGFEDKIVLIMNRKKAQKVTQFES